MITGYSPSLTTKSEAKISYREYYSPILKIILGKSIAVLKFLLTFAGVTRIAVAGKEITSADLETGNSNVFN